MIYIQLAEEHGVEFIDDIIKIEIITTDDKQSTAFLKNHKEHLKELLQQIDILITIQRIMTI